MNRHFVKALAMLLLSLNLEGCFHVQANGPIAGAKVQVTALHNSDEILAESEAWDADFLRMLFGEEAWLDLEMNDRMLFMGLGSLELEAIDPAGMYLVSASGGEVAALLGSGDSNVSYTPFQGKMHVVLSGEQLLEEGFVISPLTELAYQWIEPALPFIDDNSILSELNYISAHLVNDVNEDGVVDMLDILKANPLHKPSGFRGGGEQMHTMSLALSEGYPADSIHEMSHCIFDDLAIDDLDGDEHFDGDHSGGEPGGMHMGDMHMDGNLDCTFGSFQ